MYIICYSQSVLEQENRVNELKTITILYNNEF